jgi:hypothetical protein
MVPRIAAEIAASRIKVRRRPETVAKHAVQKGGQAVASEDRQHVICDKAAQVRHQERDAVDDGILAHALGIGAVQHALDHRLVLLANYPNELKAMGRVLLVETYRADRFQVLEML